MSLAKSFQKLPTLYQILLLVIPVVNWVTEVVVRVSALINKPDKRNILGAVLSIIFGLPLGWVDVVWVILFKHLILCKA